MFSIIRWRTTITFRWSQPTQLEKMITKFIKFSLFIRSQIHVFEQKFDQKDTFSWGMSESKCIHFPIINGFCSFSNFIIKTQSIEIQRKFTELICKFRRKKVNAFSHLNARYIIPRSHMRLMFSSCCFCCCYSLSLSITLHLIWM